MALLTAMNDTELSSMFTDINFPEEQSDWWTDPESAPDDDPYDHIEGQGGLTPLRLLKVPDARGQTFRTEECSNPNANLATSDSRVMDHIIIEKEPPEKKVIA